MIGRDLHNTLSYQRALSPAVVTDNTAQVSQWIDMADLLGVEFVIATGTLADADATFAVLVEESDDQSTITTVANTDLLPTPNSVVSSAPMTQAAFTFSDDDAVKRIGYIGIKRYVRCTVTPSANTGNAPIAMIAVGLPRLRANVVGS